MIELSAVLVMMAVFFAFIGFLRGWNKEIISTAGIVLGLFALFQFDTILRGTLLANVSRDQVFLGADRYFRRHRLFRLPDAFDHGRGYSARP